jgi:hypothetical protein
LTESINPRNTYKAEGSQEEKIKNIEALSETQTEK